MDVNSAHVVTGMAIVPTKSKGTCSVLLDSKPFISSIGFVVAGEVFWCLWKDPLHLGWQTRQSLAVSTWQRVWLMSDGPGQENQQK